MAMAAGLDLSLIAQEVGQLGGIPSSSTLVGASGSLPAQAAPLGPVVVSAPPGHASGALSTTFPGRPVRGPGKGRFGPREKSDDSASP
eukprot:9019832-Heterocapsa_arctica.AAC.1